TTTALSSSTNTPVVGREVTFTASVTGTVPGAGTPSGTVTFQDGATPLGTGTLNGAGQATFSTSTLAAGTHAITAVYAGDTTFNGSTSGSLSQVVNKADTTTALSSSANPSVVGQAVTFTATLTATAPPATTLCRSVTFQDGATPLGIGTLNGAGQAMFSTSALAAGTHAITAVYAGDANFNGS